MENDITQLGADVLRQTASEVPTDEITSKKFQDIIARMHSTLEGQFDGVALAAPQISESWRIFVISPLAFEDPAGQNLVYINPVIKKKSKKRIWTDEGCLSVRWQYGQAQRHQQVTVEAYDERGQKFTRGGSGLLAQIFQHEIEHLDGVLFIDHARDITELSEREIEKMREEFEKHQH